MGRFSGKNVYVTITTIAPERFNTPEADTAVAQIFEDEQSERPRFVWEKSGELKEHVHIVYTLKKCRQFSRNVFQPLLDFFQCKALNIQTFSRKATYVNALTGKKHKSKPYLWLFEKMFYCDLPAHEEYFDKEKLAKKKPTVVRVASAEKTALYNELKAKYDAWVADSSQGDKQLKPKEIVFQKVFSGLSQDELDVLVTDEKESFKLRCYALEHYDKLVKQIITIETIQTRKRLKALYEKRKKEYRPFQLGLAKILDTQDDRGIHLHCDEGLTGKNRFCEIENYREDTCVIQSAKTADIAFVWNPKKHKRIIVDVPRGKMEFLNTSVIEKLKNGQIMSTKYVPVFKQSEFKPTIVILGNERIARDTWTSDRLTESTTNKQSAFSLLEHEPESAYDLLMCKQQEEEIYAE